jgi:hypothetical protein
MWMGHLGTYLKQCQVHNLTMHMSNVFCALSLIKLGQTPEFIKNRALEIDTYINTLLKIPGVTVDPIFANFFQLYNLVCHFYCHSQMNFYNF